MSIDSSAFFAGELVEVRSRDEILGTLDGNGRLENLPFMPEMLRYCGRQFRVYKRAHKTCDFVNKTGVRALPGAVHLEGLRCDGAAHGGCQAQCLFFWKDAWLKRPGEAALPVHPRPACTEERIHSATRADSGPATGEVATYAWARRPGEAPPALQPAPAIPEPGPSSAGDEPVYVCQATLLPDFTRPLAPWDIRQYVEDRRSGNVSSLGAFLPRLGYRACDTLVNLGVGLGRPLRALYDFGQRLIGGRPYPAHPGRIPAGGRTPAASLNLQPGELVRVKDQAAILETVDAYNRNRGMSFSAEMAPYCGGTYRVLSRVSRILDERTGRMLRLKNECIILEGVICRAQYNKNMIFCPRATYPYWREIWLERVTPIPAAAPDRALVPAPVPVVSVSVS
jgi:hypothetical protein